MVDALDLLRCPVCGTFSEPKTTPTGRVVPHCVLPVDHGLSLGQLVEREAPLRVMWLDGEAHVDFSAIERRVLERYGMTGGVVDSPLTGLFLDIKV